MKKIVMMAFMAAFMLFTSCRDKKEPVPPTPPPAENPSADPAPEPRVKTTTTTTTTETVEEKDGTSISIGNDGVDVKSKAGEEEKNFRISKKRSEVEIKTTE